MDENPCAHGLHKTGSFHSPLHHAECVYAEREKHEQSRDQTGVVAAEQDAVNNMRPRVDEENGCQKELHALLPGGPAYEDSSCGNGYKNSASQGQKVFARQLDAVGKTHAAIFLGDMKDEDNGKEPHRDWGFACCGAGFLLCV